MNLFWYYYFMFFNIALYINKEKFILMYQLSFYMQLR